MSTTWEQLEGAAMALARSGSIKDRLAEAYLNHLAQLNAEELPDALRAQFRACNEALTREPPLRGEDAVRATVRKMSNTEADEAACSVVRLYGALVRESSLASARESALEATREAQAPPVVITAVTANGARATRSKKGVPQIISLYAHDA